MPQYTSTLLGEPAYYVYNTYKVDIGAKRWSRTRTSGSNYRKKPKHSYALLSQPTGHTSSNVVRTYKSAITQSPTTYQEAPSSVTLGATGIDYDSILSARREAVTNIRLKVKNTEWNCATWIGELPATRNWFVSVAKALIKSVRLVRKGEMKQAIRELKRVRISNGKFSRYKPIETWRTARYAGSKWLEWRYAVTPLMYDMEDMMGYLYAGSIKPDIERIASGAKARRNFNSPTNIISSSMDIRFVVYAQKSATTSEFQKLGLLNPLVPLWELTPLSFVIDWFIPIGDSLASLDAMFGVTVIGSTESRKEEGFQLVPQIRTTNGSTTSLTAGGESNWKNYQRIANPSLDWESPRWTPSLNYLKFIDTLAILQSNSADLRRLR